MHPRIILALKALIVVMLVLLLCSQAFMLPGVAAGVAERNPDLAHLELPGVIGGIVFLVLVQIVLLCVFRLLTLVRADRIFSPAAFRWVDIIFATMLAAAALIAGAFVVLNVADAMNPSIAILALLGMTVAVGIALLVVVLRGLLRKALQLEQDLSEVV
ncbi:DUF2975 domain-containing protein [Microbacterium sp. NIBRBAC000506063]|uniref:DUF2975 domain-containing protein n=1 Tax=Microbacterium sp. NIBRBAC000506063 TaxID=2734618 RepID=UPI001BB51ABC|nr:DUF2975 domain-containing protein [Microbacterium sp. NIBRBAC000506063]QTV79189.1 DUF2975 domain-containing protein [Microbacterium sp. NIBRBAC000506063]